MKLTRQKMWDEMTSLITTDDYDKRVLSSKSVDFTVSWYSEWLEANKVLSREKLIEWQTSLLWYCKLGIVPKKLTEDEIIRILKNEVLG